MGKIERTKFLTSETLITTCLASFAVLWLNINIFIEYEHKTKKKLYQVGLLAVSVRSAIFITLLLPSSTDLFKNTDEAKEIYLFV